MRRIIEIAHVEKHQDKEGKVYYRTHALVDDGTEVTGRSQDDKHFDLDDKVEVFLNGYFINMRHKPQLCKECDVRKQWHS